MFISMPPAARRAHKGKLLTFSPDVLVRLPSLVRVSANSQKNGGDGRDRTDDLMLAKQLLSQLSYVP